MLHANKLRSIAEKEEKRLIKARADAIARERAEEQQRIEVESKKILDKIEKLTQAAANEGRYMVRVCEVHQKDFKQTISKNLSVVLVSNLKGVLSYVANQLDDFGYRVQLKLEYGTNVDRDTNEYDGWCHLYFEVCW